MHFKPDIDLFASRLNSQFPKYVAYRLDPESVATDAFTIQIYSSTPFPHLVLYTLCSRRFRRTMPPGCAYYRTDKTQTWFPKAMKVILQEPVELNANKTLLHLPNQPIALHPLHKKLTLLICLLSGLT